MKKIFSELVLAVAMAGLGQAPTVAKPNDVAKPDAVVKPKGAAIRPQDVQIERTIRAKFAKSKINADHFTVSVQNGIAVIEGKTNVIQHKGVATRLAKTGGALAVQNHIQISDEARAKAAAKLAKNRGGDEQLARATVVQPAKPK